MRAQIGKRLMAMEARRSGQGRKRRVDLHSLSDEDLDGLERLALDRQAWPGSLDGWLASLPTAEHEELMRLHALAQWRS
ncbi:MAG: hypothetical protein QM589_17280 [Thermomicrobiales bacterium]